MMTSRVETSAMSVAGGAGGRSNLRTSDRNTSENKNVGDEGKVRVTKVPSESHLISAISAPHNPSPTRPRRQQLTYAYLTRSLNELQKLTEGLATKLASMEGTMTDLHIRNAKQFNPMLMKKIRKAESNIRKCNEAKIADPFPVFPGKREVTSPSILPLAIVKLPK